MIFNKHSLKQGEMLCTTTIRIETVDEGGNYGAGTGFFYSIDQDTNHIPAIFTNKHVIKGAKSIKIVVTESDNEGNRINNHHKFNIDHISAGIVDHPDPDVDLCAIPIRSILEELRDNGKDLHAYYINRNILLNTSQLRNMDAIEDILMVGYPNGLWDEVNNMPLVRKGITSTHPGLDYNGKQEFLIDAAIFHGSSGSPIFYMDRTFKTEISTGKIAYPVFLIGVLYSGPIKYIEGFINHPGKAIETLSKTTINLGYVIKSNRLIELEQEILKKINL